jgi:hypothetical protein
MLDLTKLALQMQHLSRHLLQEAEAGQGRLAQAEHLLQQLAPQWRRWQAQVQQWTSSLAFNAGIPVESPLLQPQIPAVPALHTVLATDGSQIAPSHHEIAYCYLINIGRVRLSYGQRQRPLLESQPEIFYKREDLQRGRAWGLRPEEWLGYQRTLLEAIALADLAPSEPVADWETQLSLLSVPTVALVDGSLIHWFLDGLPNEARDAILLPILESWEQLRQRRIPVVGYLSASRSADVVNSLRLGQCPFPEPHCNHHCPDKPEEVPCRQGLLPLRDATLWGSRLQPGQRSSLWRSSARILEHYGDHAVVFCYLHVGTEIARIEVPQWVAQEPHLRDLALSVVLDQTQKGYGYPIALAEAHNQAVVQGGDRQRFFALLERQLVQSGLSRVGPSAKETRKRGSIA